MFHGMICSIGKCPSPVTIWAFPGDWGAGGGGDHGKACISKASSNLCKKWVLRRKMGKVRTHVWEVEDRNWPEALD